MDANDKLFQKLQEEQNSYNDWLLKQEPKVILQSAAEYALREDIMTILEYDHIPNNLAQAMLKQEDVLHSIYEVHRDSGSDKTTIILDSLITYAQMVDKHDFIDHFYVVKDLLKQGSLEIANFQSLGEALMAYHQLSSDKRKALGIHNSEKIPGCYDFIQCIGGHDRFILDYKGSEKWQNEEITKVVNAIKKDLGENNIEKQVYLETASYARQHNQIEEYRCSKKRNVACRDAIQRAIHEGYRDNRLDPKIVKPLLEEWGLERVSCVIAVTILNSPWDERYSKVNRDWANELNLPYREVGAADNPSREYSIVEAHPGLVNLVANHVRKQYPHKTQKRECYER